MIKAEKYPRAEFARHLIATVLVMALTSALYLCAAEVVPLSCLPCEDPSDTSCSPGDASPPVGTMERATSQGARADRVELLAGPPTCEGCGSVRSEVAGYGGSMTCKHCLFGGRLGGGCSTFLFQAVQLGRPRNRNNQGASAPEATPERFAPSYTSLPCDLADLVHERLAAIAVTIFSSSPLIGCSAYTSLVNA